jgi:hypothetical protein
MGQKSWIINKEGEEEYVDKGAITSPTPNVRAQREAMIAQIEADIADFVKWPTDVNGQEKQGF